MTHDFETKRKFAEKWEKKIRPILERLFFKLKLETQNFDTVQGRKNQLNGIDAIITQDSWSFDLKVNAYKFFSQKKLLLETISVKTENQEILGWLFTSDADYIIHVWLNKKGFNLISKGYIILLKELRRTIFFKNIKKDYYEFNTSSRRGNRFWKTFFIMVPIKDFPQGIIYEFNPYIINLDAKQIKLEEIFQKPNKITDYCK